MLDYLKEHFHVTLFIKEAGFRLELPETTIASACVLYHKFIATVDNQHDFDLDVVACTVLYLAGKAEETQHKLRDVINICYGTLNKEKAPLQVTKKYWKLRESVVKCELQILRQLGFQVSFDNPHKYLLHYLKIFEDWVDTPTWSVSELPQLSWSVLNDTFHTTLCVSQHPAKIVLAVLYFTLSCTGLTIPSDLTHPKWWQVFCQDFYEEELLQIVNVITDMYEFEKTAKCPGKKLLVPSSE